VAPAHRSLARLIVAGALLAAPALAANPGDSERLEEQRKGEAPARPRGRPKVVLDRLVFPADVAAAAYEKHLRRTLAREARRADWGAGRKNRIEYRFYVTELAIEEHADALRVRCTALGKLPKGKSAKSQLAYSGDKNQRGELVRRVLDIVAKGVITRLAELERVRRGDLRETGIRRPESGAPE
jgi:hypothetical protein